MTLTQIQQQKQKLTENYQRYMAALDTVAELIQAEPAPQPEPQPVAVVHQTRSKPVKAQRNGKPGRKPRITDAGARAISIGATLREPFTTAELAEALGCDTKNGCNWVQRWKAKNWLIDGPTHGTYQRTPMFGGGQALLAQIHAEIDSEKAKA